MTEAQSRSDGDFQGKSGAYVVISTDGHCGADLLAYKPYLGRKYHDEFDRWANTYHDWWSDIDAELPEAIRFGTASFSSRLNWDSEERLACIDAEGIAAEVLFPNTSPPFFPSGVGSPAGPRDSKEFEYRFAGLQAHNRWLAEFCSEAPQRRAGFAQVFLNDIEAAGKLWKLSGQRMQVSRAFISRAITY